MFHFGNIYCFVVSVLQDETFCHLLETVPDSQVFSDSARMRFGVILFFFGWRGGAGSKGTATPCLRAHKAWEFFSLNL